MKNAARICSVLVLAMAAMAVVSCGRRFETRNLGVVERWQPLELTVRAKVDSPNPFLVPFQAKVTTPDGKELVVPGFHDGEDVWRVRVMPHTSGKWTVRTESDASELNGYRYVFTCGVETPVTQQHGRLRVDSDHPAHFKFEDGSRFFMLAYECDWLWALDAGSEDLVQTDKFLDLIGSYGFNSVIVNSYAYDTKWREGKTGPDDYGPPPMRPWVGTEKKPDHLRLNVAYWQHFDRMMQALHDRGIIAHLLCKVYNKRVKWPEKGSQGDELFFRTLIARYSAYPGVIWDFSKEAHNEKDRDYKLSRVRYLREADPFRHLVTVHDDDKMYESGAYDSLVDFRTDQQHAAFGATVRAQHQQRAWPVMNSEFGYEHGAGGPTDVTYAVGHAPEAFVKRAWEISFAGGYTAYYHTHTAWDVLRPEVNPPGYRLFSFLRQFFQGTQYWKLVPRVPAADGMWVLENPGEEMVVWMPQGSTSAVALPVHAKEMSATWFEPLTGRRTTLADGWAAGESVSAPAGVSEGPVILHLRKK